MSERAVVVIEFEVTEEGFFPLLDALRGYLDGGPPTKRVFGAIRDDAQRVIDILDDFEGDA